MPQQIRHRLCSIALPIVALAAIAVSEANGQTSVVRSSRNFTVVELFTSQGCSSCPPADKLLRQIVENNEQSGRRVYALSFHVDYWNRLGWRDPFSSAEASKRQRAYAGLMQSNRVYTPQMIVDGKTEFVGSNGKMAKAAITDSYSREREGILNLTVTADSDTIKVDVKTEAVPEGTLINFALVQTEATTKVSRGENASRTLSHRNVVRDFQKQALVGSNAAATLTKPHDGSEVTVIVYAQNPKSGTIIAAAAASDS